MEELKITDRRNRPEETAVVEASPNAVVMMAMQKGYSPELVEKMMDLQSKYEANEARKAFFQAVAEFKRNPPQVLKDKENAQFSKGSKKAMYVSLGNLVQTVNPALGEHGLSVSWDVSQTDKLVKVSCRLSHRFGHSESVTMEAPPDTSGGNAKNPIQQIKSTVTYLRAATFEAVTGIAATDDANIDDDGNGSGNGNYISDQQQADIRSLMQEVQADEAKFLTYLKVDSVEHIPAARFKMAVSALEAKRQKVKERQPGEDG